MRVYDGLVRLCDYAGKSVEWCDKLWQEMLSDREVYDEFVYYLEHHVPGDLMKVRGYSLTDLYVWQIEQYGRDRNTYRPCGFAVTRPFTLRTRYVNIR